MVYKLKCPRCLSEDCINVDLTDARVNCNVGIDKDGGDLEYSDYDFYESEDTFYCTECQYISKNPNDFIIEE